MDVTTTPPAIDQCEFRDLGVSGGRHLGSDTVALLAELEVRSCAPPERRFDLKADTPVDWILVIALGYGFLGKRSVGKHHAC